MNTDKLSNIISTVSLINFIFFIYAIFRENISTFYPLGIAFVLIFSHFYVIQLLVKKKKNLHDTTNKDLKDSINDALTLNKFLLFLNSVISIPFVLLMFSISKYA